MIKLARKIDEPASDVEGCGMVTRCHQHCGGATDQHIDRVVDSLLCVGDGDEKLDGSTAVILREKLALKPLDVVDETRVFRRVRMWMRRGQESPGSHTRRSRKDVAVCMYCRTHSPS